MLVFRVFLKEQDLYTAPAEEDKVSDRHCISERICICFGRLHEAYLFSDIPRSVLHPRRLQSLPHGEAEEAYEERMEQIQDNRPSA